MNRQTKTAIIEKFLREDLAPYCGENFTIHQAALEDFSYREEYWEPGDAPPLRITIVYEGDRRQIPIEWEIGMSDRIWPKLLPEGIEGLPLFDFAEKSWWLKHQRPRPLSESCFPDTPAIPPPTEARTMSRLGKTALIEKFLREDLDPYCGKNFTIHQVALEDGCHPDVYREPGDNPHLHITVVYEGDRQQIPLEWELGMSPRLWDKLLAENIEGLPLFDFVEKSWWLKHNQQRRI